MPSVPFPAPEPAGASRAALNGVLALADGLARTLRVSRALAEAGRPIDLAGLDQACGLLCAKTLDLPPDEGRMLADRLGALRAEADLLAHAMAPAGAMPPRQGTRS